MIKVLGKGEEHDGGREIWLAYERSELFWFNDNTQIKSVERILKRIMPLY